MTTKQKSKSTPLRDLIHESFGYGIACGIIIGSLISVVIYKLVMK